MHLAQSYTGRLVRVQDTPTGDATFASPLRSRALRRT